MSRLEMYKSAKVNGFEGKKWPSGDKQYWIEAANSSMIVKATSTIDNILNSDRRVILKTVISGKGDLKTFINNSNRAKAIELLLLKNKGYISTWSEQCAGGGKCHSSDAEILYTLKVSDILSQEFIDLPKPNKVYKNKDGKYFEYTNMTDIPLERYQIYKTTSKQSKEHCLMFALSKCGIKKGSINAIKQSFIAGHSIKRSSIPDISKLIGRDINLYTIDKDNEQAVQRFKCGKEGKAVNLAIYLEHYFIFEDTAFSRFSIKNYDEVKSLHNFKDIISKSKDSYEFWKEGKKHTKSLCNSLRLIDTLFKAGHFEKLDVSSQPVPLKWENIYLNNLANESRKFDIKPVKKTGNVHFADSETYVKGEHGLQLLGYVSTKDDDVTILNRADYTEQQMVDKMLKTCDDGDIIYFHNLKYDFTVLSKYLPYDSSPPLEKDGQHYGCSLLFEGKSIQLWDSYKMMTMPLSKFAKAFGLEKSKGELINYEYYTPENNGLWCKPKDYVDKRWSVDKVAAFYEQVAKVSVDDMFNPMDWYKGYLKLDCLVLKQGSIKFNHLVKQITGLDTFESRTLASIADRYFSTNGGYDGVHEVSGNLRAYIAKACFGGRCNVNDAYRYKVIRNQIADLDACSLYPAAIARICREMGFPTGAPIKMRKVEDFWNLRHKMTFAVLTIKITKVGRKQQMPFIAVRTANGIEYTNSPPSDDMVVDLITLEDYVKFHEIEYTVKEAIYWTGAVVKTMGKLVEDMYTERKVQEKIDDTLGGAFKLILNSTYGKTLLKQCFSKSTLVKGVDKVNSYIYNNFNTIKKMSDYREGVTKVVSYAPDMSFNRAHIGCMILSMSKRIMNEVFDVADKAKIPIYYTDTDSMMMPKESELDLAAAYKMEYGKDMLGDKLGQFNSDFKLTGSKEGADITCNWAIYCGKKAYAMELKSINDKDVAISGMHIRLKGVTMVGIDAVSRLLSDNSIEGRKMIYRLLASGVEIPFVLNPSDVECVMFNFVNNTVSTRGEFVRKVSFPGYRVLNLQRLGVNFGK